MCELPTREENKKKEEKVCSAVYVTLNAESARACTCVCVCVPGEIGEVVYTRLGKVVGVPGW